MVKVEQTVEEVHIVALAQRLGCVDETCNRVDYHPDHGRVMPYWKPKWFVVAMAREINRSK